MYVIGLTGGIASGKSTAAQVLRDLGAEVIDADAISHTITSRGGAAESAIRARFGTLDRKTLGAIVFSDPKAREALNAIVHPLVHREILAQMDAAQGPIVVLDVPLLFETGMETLADEVWVVHVPYEEQVMRLMQRDNLPTVAAIARIKSQMSTAEKLERADRAIDTSTPLEETRERIAALWEETLHRVQAEQERRDEAAREEAAALADAEEAPYARRTHRRRSGRVQRQREEPEPLPRPAALMARQRALEAQASIPVLSQTPLEPAPLNSAWEDTSTLLDAPERRSFLARQKPLFWIVAVLLLIALIVLLGIIGVNAWKEEMAERAERQRLEQLAEEKARYRLVYRDLIEENAAREGIDPALIAAVIYNESRFDPDAVSHLGARGLMQIMEGTGGWIALMLGETDQYAADDLFVPETNIRYGVWYLGYLSRSFDGDLVKMLAGYHAGQNAVKGWLEDPQYSSDGVTLQEIPYPGTDQYVRRVINAYEIYIKHYYSAEAAESAVEAGGA